MTGSTSKAPLVVAIIGVVMMLSAWIYPTTTQSDWDYDNSVRCISGVGACHDSRPMTAFYVIGGIGLVLLLGGAALYWVGANQKRLIEDMAAQQDTD